MKPASPTDDLIVELMQEYCARLSMGAAPFHLEDVESLYITDERFTAYDLAPPNAGYIGWPAYAEGWRKIMNNYAFFEMEYVGEIDGGRSGDVIWSLAPFQVFVKAKPDDPPLRKEGRVSLVWILQDGAWRIVHEHVSTPRIPPASS